ncbi:Uncharacterized protein PBTT_03721 [Plasmodiophora brassicae]
MAIQRSNTCCCGCSLPTAMVIFGVVTILVGLLEVFLVASPHLLPADRLSKEQRERLDNIPNYNTALLIRAAIHLAVGIVYLVAVLNKSMVFAKIAIAADVISIVFELATKYMWMHLYVNILTMAIKVYFCYIVWSYHEMLKEQQQCSLPAPSAPGYRY